MENHNYLRICIKHHIRSWVKRPSPAMIGLLCTGCRLGIDRGILNLSMKERIPVIIMGGTRVDSQTDFKYNIMKLNPDDNSSISFVLGYLQNIFKNPRWILNYNCLYTQFMEYYVHYFSKSAKRKAY